MIASATRGSGFAGLQAYLLHGKDGRQAERVEWVAVRNLPADDPELVASLMRATAETSRRVEKPVYHLSISLPRGERLDQEAMLRMVDRTLRDLQLAEHQAFIVAHNDTPSQHVHVMVNRVHPETGIAWNGEHDYARIESSLRRQERELGLREVPGRHADLGSNERHQGVGVSRGDRHFEERTGEMAFGRHVREVARRDLREASSWDELHGRLCEVGLRLEKRGRGLVVTDGERRVKASFVDRRSSLAGLERRLGPLSLANRDFPAGKSRRWAEIHGLRRAVGEIQRRQHQGGRERRGRWEAAARGRALDRSRGRVRVASETLDRRLVEVYRDPRSARSAFDRIARERGFDRALRTLSREPVRLGALLGRGGVLGSRGRREALARLPRAVAAATDLAVARSAPRAAVRSPAGPGRRRTRGSRRWRRIPDARLSRLATRLVRRVGWNLALRALPSPQIQVLRLALAVGRKGLEAGVSREAGR